MKRIATFCALCALWGCRVSDAPEMVGIALSYATSEQSKTDVLAQEDEIGVFAAIEGTENYFLENTKYSVGSDGRSLSTTPAVYYPDRKEAVTFTAYLPFGGTWSGVVGTFAVPIDQSTATALKQADLCWAAASSTPVAAAVPLEFTHKLARLLVTTNTPTTTPTEKIAIPNAFSGGTLNIKTGAFTNTLQSEVFTTGTELILPAQTLSRLLLTVAGIEYVFAPVTPITLTEGHTTSLSLTLNPTQKTATLSGSSTTNWIGSATQGNPTQAVSNTLTLHWAPKAHNRSAEVNKVVLTINKVDYTISSGITYDNNTFMVPFASSSLIYPYTIQQISFYKTTESLQSCAQLLGATIYKSGASTLGIKDQANAVLINGVWWATGNLIADGANGCKIGAPADGGLYFQFGSLVGWSGGSSGSGVGVTNTSLSVDKAVWPLAMGTTKPSFAWQSKDAASITTLSHYYFNYSSGWATSGQDIRGFKLPFTGDAGSGDLGSGRYAKWGVGDPCTYYLGAPWRLPTTNEYVAMCNNKSGINSNYSWVDAGGTWVPGSGGNLQGTKLFFPASGNRNYSNGSFGYVTTRGYYWSSSVYSATTGLNLHFNSSWVYPQSYYNRSYGFPVRCVRSVP